MSPQQHLHIGGVTPSRPTLTRLASSEPSSFFTAPKMISLAPGLSSDLSLATKVTIGVSVGTTTFFSVLVLDRDVLAVGALHRLRHGGVGHGRVGARIPGTKT